nr:AraC family ligand binding domain-containing protein [Endozoicomonas sp.]
MTATAELTDKDANRFLRRLFDSVESDQQFFKYLNVASRGLCVKGSWTDHSILRPQTKAGWTIHVTLKGSGYYNCVRTTLQTQPDDILLFSPTAYLAVRRAGDCDQWLYSWVTFQDEGGIKDMLNWPEIASGIHHIRKAKAVNQCTLVKKECNELRG